MMTKMEIATYIGLANLLLASAETNMDGGDREYTTKIREALCQAQLLLTQQAIEEFVEGQ